ncbi:MAG: SDR family oxidoreductase [Patescibacteria group bacterium]
MEIKGTIAVITGGSRGFGKALAEAFKRQGAVVIISSDEQENLKNAAEELGVDLFRADVASYEEVKKLADYAVEKYGKIDVWINNAGIQIAPSPADEVDIQELHRLFNINFFGYFYGCKAALSYFKTHNNGTIININSTAGLDGKPGISAYASSKFAIKGLTESIRKETENTDIKIYGIFPGGMQTDIYKEKQPDDLNDYMKVEYVVEKVIANLKLGNPEIDFIIKRSIK